MGSERRDLVSARRFGNFTKARPGKSNRKTPATKAITNRLSSPLSLSQKVNRLPITQEAVPVRSVPSRGSGWVNHQSPIINPQSHSVPPLHAESVKFNSRGH